MTAPVNDNDRPNTIHWPPLLYVVALAAAWLLERLIPLPVVMPAPPSGLIGGPLFLLGLGIALGAWWANSAWGRYWGWDPKETSCLFYTSPSPRDRTRSRLPSSA